MDNRIPKTLNYWIVDRGRLKSYKYVLRDAVVRELKPNMREINALLDDEVLDSNIEKCE